MSHGYCGGTVGGRKAETQWYLSLVINNVEEPRKVTAKVKPKTQGIGS